MSLLLDALKKAELAKRKAQQEKALTPTTELLQPAHPVSESFPSLELAATVEVAAEPARDHVGPIQVESPSFTLMPEESDGSAAESAGEKPINTSALELTPEPEADQVSPPEVPVTSESEPEAIEFRSEKTPESAPVITPPPKIEQIAMPVTAASPAVAQRILNAGKKPDSQRRRLGLILLGLLLGLLLGGLYLFGPALFAPTTPALVIPPQASETFASQVTASVAAATGAAVPSSPSKGVNNKRVVADVPTLPRKTNATGARAVSKRSQKLVSSSLTAGKNATTAETTSTKGPVLENTTPQPGVAPLVAQGYAAYQRGDLELASKKYRQAVNEDDQNRDALLGLAATSRRLGDLDTARRAYKQLLYLNPRDVDAKAGLSAIQGVTDPQSGVESIKPLSERETDSAPVQSELGAMYVRQGRWSEAQAAYFNAFSANPTNPDLAFNLAICLDHLNQPKLALDYYRKAKQLGARNPHRFDPQQLDKRVSELEGAL